MVNSAHRTAAWVLSVFRDRSTTTMMQVYKSLIRSELAYCCPVWSPTKIEDIKTIESLQRTFTSKISGIQHLSYWERLDRLNLMSLQRRRERYHSAGKRDRDFYPLLLGPRQPKAAEGPRHERAGEARE